MNVTASTNGFSRASTTLPAIDVLWLTAGLSCDGDTIAATAATQPSIEDLVLGTFPWVPKIRLHNSFLAYENGGVRTLFPRSRRGPPRAVYPCG